MSKWIVDDKCLEYAEMYSDELSKWSEEEVYSPAAAAKPLICCKDCKFGSVIDETRYPGNICPGFIEGRYCLMWSDKLLGELVEDDGFCYKAEPKEASNE